MKKSQKLDPIDNKIKKPDSALDYRKVDGKFRQRKSVGGEKPRKGKGADDKQI